MKKLIFLPVLFMLLNVHAQSFIEALETSGGLSPSIFSNGTNSREGYKGNPLEWSKINGVNFQFDDIVLRENAIEGSAFLFDNWKNRGVLMVGEKEYVFLNINYHIQKESFMSEMDGDSTFVFNLNNVNRVSINGRHFKSIYNVNESKNKVYEIVYESKKLSLLKGHGLKYINPNPNPMVSRPVGKIKHIKKYFVYKDDRLSPIKLKKSKILELFDIDKRKLVVKYAKKNKLSFKKERNLQQILHYYMNL